MLGPCVSNRTDHGKLRKMSFRLLTPKECIKYRIKNWMISFALKSKVLTPVKRVFSTSWFSGIATVPPEMNRNKLLKLLAVYARQPKKIALKIIFHYKLVRFIYPRAYTPKSDKFILGSSSWCMTTQAGVIFRIKWIVFVSQWLLRNVSLTNHFQRRRRIISSTDKHCSLDPEDVFRSESKRWSPTIFFFSAVPSFGRPHYAN